LGKPLILGRSTWQGPERSGGNEGLSVGCQGNSNKHPIEKVRAGSLGLSMARALVIYLRCQGGQQERKNGEQCTTSQGERYQEVKPRREQD